jgi:hypothetical protein
MDPFMKASHYQPQAPDERIEGISLLLSLHSRNGFVFLLSRTRKLTQDAEPLFQTLSDQIHRLAESFGTEANAQHRFEQFLGALNESLAQQVRDGRFRVPIHQFDAIVGIACEQKMFFSGAGDLCALFLHRKPSSRYQIFNLFRSIQTEQSLPTWEKPFAVVLDGDLHEGDVFAVCNQDLQHAIVSDELNQILTTLPPIGAIEKIRQYFPHRTAFLLLVLKLSETIEPAAESRAIPKTDLSIRQFNEQEHLTEQLLADQIPRLSTLIQTSKRLFKHVREQKIWRFLWRWTRRIVWNLFKSATHLKTKEGRVETKNRLVGHLRVSHLQTKRLFNKLTHLPRSTKYLGVGIVAVVLALTVGVSMLSASRARSQEREAYQEKIEAINDLMERAAGAVIYKDENQARGLFINASTLIDQLPIDTPERQQKTIELKEAIQKSTDEIQHLVTVPNPALLGDLATLTDGVFGQSFIKMGSEFYVFSSDGRVYQLDRAQKVFKSAATQVDENRVALSASADDENAYALMTDQGLVQFIKEESVQKPIQLTKPEGTFVDLFAYANRLYVLTLTESDGQVYRYGKNGAGFGNASRWITSKTTSLKTARAITIDGTLFVLQKNGTIVHLVSGSEVGWKSGVVDPPMTNAAEIWTDTESKYLYVIEPDTQRVIVFDKSSGAFVVQYRSSSFNGLSDILVDEPGYAIYLLSGSKIYSIAASHLK